MKIRSFLAVAIGVVVLLTQALAAEAADVKVLSAGAIRAVLNELGPQFERVTGHKLAIQFMNAPELKRRVDAGEAFDVAIFTQTGMDYLTKQAKIAAATRADIARFGIGVAVRAGGPKPDISSVDAFRRTLVNAKSVAYGAEGTSGIYFMGLLDRLGIAADMRAKLRPMAVGAAVPAVARGEAEISVIPIPSVSDVAGAELVGPLPAELQMYLVFTAAVGATAKEPEAAKALIGILTAPAAIAVIKAKGMEPVTP